MTKAQIPYPEAPKFFVKTGNKMIPDADINIRVIPMRPNSLTTLANPPMSLVAPSSDFTFCSSS